MTLSTVLLVTVPPLVTTVSLPLFAVVGTFALIALEE